MKDLIWIWVILISSFVIAPALLENENKGDYFVLPPDDTSHFFLVELNSCDSLELIEIPGIGSYFAHRILKYRRALGGYYHLNQLSEMKMKYFHLDSLKTMLMVDSNLIVKKDMNKLTFSDLVRHPYLEYEDVKMLFKAKREYGYLSMKLLSREKILPQYKVNKIRAYYY